MPPLLIPTEDCRIPDDILSRAYVVHLNELSDESRKPAADLDRELNRLASQVVAWLLKGTQIAIKRHRDIHANQLSRMADAAVWMAAAAPTFGIAEEKLLATLLKPPKPHRRKDKLLPALIALENWKGTATELLQLLPDHLKPQTEKELGNRLSRMIYHLNEAGIELQRHHTKFQR